MSDKLQIIMPTGALGSSAGEHVLITAMRIIGVGFGEAGDWCAKYGTNFENDVFAMRRFYWGDCECGFAERSEEWHDANQHAQECYQTDLNRREIAAGIHYTQDFKGSYDKRRKKQDAIYRGLAEKYGTDPVSGAAVHCTCYHAEASKKWYGENDHAETCGVILPNFHFKPTDFRLEWYKYIGRDMDVKRGELPADFMQQVFASHPKGMTLDEAIAETARQEQATAESFAKMFADLGVNTSP